jgi:Arc/MetJ-type ribon-helix-helix transcriptional regulator
VRGCRPLLGNAAGSDYSCFMGEMSFDFPPDLRRLIAARVEEGDYAGPADYVRDLIRQADEAGIGGGLGGAKETPEYIAWAREKIAEGLASPLVDRDPRDIINGLIAKRRSKRD